MSKSSRTAGAGQRPVWSEKNRELLRLEALARLLDSRFRIPGTQIRLGWDAIVGIVPGLGDTVMLVPGAYILFRARRLKMPLHVLLRMTVNLLVDWLFGSIPIIGVFFDIGFKANLWNLRLIQRELERRSAQEGGGLTTKVRGAPLFQR